MVWWYFLEVTLLYSVHAIILINLLNKTDEKWIQDVPKKNAIFLAKFCLEEKKGQRFFLKSIRAKPEPTFFFFFAIKNYVTIWLKNAYQMGHLLYAGSPWPDHTKWMLCGRGTQKGVFYRIHDRISRFFSKKISSIIMWKYVIWSLFLCSKRNT